jgi:hypothetical protein
MHYAKYVLLLCCLAGVSFAYKYTCQPTTVDERPYLIHRFKFNEEEIDIIASSYRKAQGYANGMIDCIWDMAKGEGSDLGKFVGRVYLGDWLYRTAKDAQENGDDEMWVKIRSRADEEGKWALEFLDWLAGVWKDLSGMK